MESPFFSNNFDLVIKSALNKAYPLLVDSNKDILLKYVRKILLLLSLIYNFKDNQESFMHELTQNNYQAIIWITSFLLPHLENSSQITDFNDMYHRKIEDVDINTASPKYFFSNIQYGRCKRSLSNIQEIDFDESHMEQNFKLLCMSLVESSHKLYVNWMDILPIKLNEFEKSRLYQNTRTILSEGNFREYDFNLTVNEEDEKLLHSIQICDIYNVIRNYLYEEIIPLKLLIYDLINVTNNEIMPSILFLNNYFNNTFKFIIDKVDWDLLSDTDRSTFEQQFKKLIEHTLTNTDVYINRIDNDVNNSHYISATSIIRLVKALCITFDNQYRDNKDVKKSGYIPIKKEIDYDENDEEEVNTIYKDEEFEEQLNTINAKFMYIHLSNLVNRFKYTIYGTIMFNSKKDKINIITNEAVIKVSPDFNFKYLKFVTLKNIYNFAKSISRYQSGDDYLLYPKHWKNLEPNEKTEILNRLNGNSSSKWFNISRYIKYITDALGAYVNVNVYNKELFTILKREYLVQFVFKALIYKGVLSQFKPNKELTDKTITDRSNTSVIVSKMNPLMFVTSEQNPYGLTAYSYLSEMPYLYSGQIFESNKSGWFSLAALDWVSQIGFIHKFINTRVSYITGGTGVGKSTQVPKLFLYYLKALDYNSSGRVVCTQPRRAPTRSNATRVSFELGFPIVKESEERSTDYYVQMQFKGADGKHIQNAHHLFLKYITDGTLVQEFKNANPIFKPINPDGTVSNANLYDIVIIDEAHEHGKNMDVLLTLMRDFTYFNPSIRLIILSATMADDEPVYRRYYRDINDNLKYPHDTSLRELQLDRVNIDRRYHVSPPGMATIFKIDEIYRPGKRDNIQILSIVEEIIRGGLRGDILIFQSGEADIKALVQELNDNTPDNILALPFYSSMDEDRKKIIEGIDRYHSLIRLSKREDYAVASTINGNNSYSNFIICATNIAEASITISRLHYVIETGTRKSMIYSYKRRTGKLEEVDISESSRLQRKGRVGRKGPGIVYYTYPKNHMYNNKIQFEFSISNISDSIFSSIRTNLNENERITLENVLENKQMKEQFGYLFNTTSGVFNYIGDETIYDHNYEYKYTPQLYKTGYKSDSLYDATGDFYIVHPEELYIDRNIMGKIIKSNKPDIEVKNNKVKSVKIDSFYEDLLMKKYLVRENDSYYKTELGKLINEVQLSFDIEDQVLCEILVYSILYNTYEQIITICAMLVAAQNNILSMFIPSTEKRIYNLDVIKNLDIVKNEKTEMSVLYNLGKDIIRFVMASVDLKEIDKKTIMHFNLSEDRYKKIVDMFETVDKEEESKDIESREKIIGYRIGLIATHPKFNETIKRIADIYNINNNFVREFIKTYLVLLDNTKSLSFPNKRRKTYINELNKYKSQFVANDFDPVILTFMTALPYNIAKRILQTDYFLSAYSPSNENIFGISKYRQIEETSTGKKVIKFRKATLIKEEYLSDYIFYLDIGLPNDTILIPCYINKKYLSLYHELYNLERLGKVSSSEFKKIDRHLEKLNSTIPQQIIMEDIRALQHVKKTYDEILSDVQ